MRHFLDLIDVPAADLRKMIDVGARHEGANARRDDRPLAGKTLAMIFERPSTRTRVSFEVAMRQLGGDAIVLTARRCSSAAAKRLPIPRGCCRATSTPS